MFRRKFRRILTKFDNLLCTFIFYNTFFGVLAVHVTKKDCRFLSSLTVLGKHSDLLLEGSLQFSASIRIYSSKGLTILGKMYIYT